MAGKISRLGVCSMIAIISIGLASATHAAPVGPSNIGQVLGSEFERASFWGLPFPYGYDERPYGYAERSSACERYVRVRTRHGVKRKLVWVCK